MELNLPNDSEIGVLTQTTLSVDDTSYLIQKLRDRYPNIITGGKEDICYATQNRQDAVKELAKDCDLIIVIGSANSSNSNRLVETAKQLNVESFIIDLPDELDASILNSFDNIGITSGASVPSYLIERLLERIKEVSFGIEVSKKDSIEKDILFPLPRK